jgi:hypothetical protein
MKIFQGEVSRGSARDAFGERLRLAKAIRSEQAVCLEEVVLPQAFAFEALLAVLERRERVPKRRSGRRVSGYERVQRWCTDLARGRNDGLPLAKKQSSRRHPCFCDPSATCPLPSKRVSPRPKKS